MICDEWGESNKEGTSKQGGAISIGLPVRVMENGSSEATRPKVRIFLCGANPEREQAL
jgi:hypothetical protein